MSVVGIDLEQFVRDPYATGIQRVLQQLALHWPREVSAEWVIPNGDGTYTLLDSSQAADLLTLAFTSATGAELRARVGDAVETMKGDREIPKVRMGQLVSLYDAWLLPEVSYLPSVLERLDIFARSMPVVMIGYDALPMTEPGNYRFVPGSGAYASEYFRRLASADSVVCISDDARMAILDRLRRSRALRTTVAHPGGDHLAPRPKVMKAINPRPHFVRLGTMEARKRPIEILRGFQAAVRQGHDAELIFIGNANASSHAVNEEVERAIADGYPVSWIRGASDAEVYDLVHTADAFLSIGVEGYGIPVLEAVRLGTPVLFDGVQPAGDLMEGRGAIRVPAMSQPDMVELFGARGRAAISAAGADLDPESVPTWSAFASAIAQESARL